MTISCNRCEHRVVNGLRSVGAAAHGPRIALVLGETATLIRPVEIEVSLGRRVVVVEPQLPLRQPIQRTFPVIREAAVDAVVAAELAARVARADGPLITPRHVDPSVPAADHDRRVLHDRLKLRGGSHIVEVRVRTACAGQEASRQSQNGHPTAPVPDCPPNIRCEVGHRVHAELTRLIRHSPRGPVQILPIRPVLRVHPMVARNELRSTTSVSATFGYTAAGERLQVVSI